MAESRAFEDWASRCGTSSDAGMTEAQILDEHLAIEKDAFPAVYQFAETGRASYLYPA